MRSFSKTSKRKNKQTNSRSKSTSATRTNPALWVKVKKEVTRGSKGGSPGKWSAR